MFAALYAIISICCNNAFSAWNSYYMGVITHKKKKTLLDYCLLTAFFIFVCFLCWFMTMNQLSRWLGPGGSISNDLYLPAIMMNAGHGFTLSLIHI